MSPRRLLMFDRDGTLTYEQQGHHPDLAALSPYPFAGPLLRDLDAAGYQLAVVTNQSGVARGLWTLEDVDAVHQRFSQAWGVAPRFYICHHAPDDGCNCRKPEPGLLRQAMATVGALAGGALLIGDSLADAGAAQQAGVEFVLVLTGRGRATLEELSLPPALVLDTVAGLRAHLG